MYTILIFRHSGSLVLTVERQSARIPEIKNCKLDLYGAEHSKCDRMMTLGFKRLITVLAGDS